MLSNLSTMRLSIVTNPNYSNFINYLFILYAFFIPLSGHITNYIFTLIIFLWVFEGDIKQKITYAFSHKFIQALFLFYFMHFVWLWSSENTDFAIATIKNSRFLLYAIVFITAIKQEFIYKILLGFIYAMMLSEITSYLIHFQILPPINNATIEDPVPFALSHTTYSLYLSLSVGLMLYMSIKSHISTTLKIIYFIFFISASVNIFIIASRLGFFLYASSIFTVLLFMNKENYRRTISLGILLIIIGYFLAYSYSTTFRIRIHETIENTITIMNNQNFGTSLGNRIGHWYYGSKLIPQNFFFGVGDGDQITEFTKIVTADNTPHETILIENLRNGIHSELVDIFAKFGIIGFLIYLNIYYQLLKLKPNDPFFNVLKYLLVISFFLSALQGGAIVMAVKDLGKLFVLFGVLIVLNSLKDSKSYGK